MRGKTRRIEGETEIDFCLVIARGRTLYRLKLPGSLEYRRDEALRRNYNRRERRAIMHLTANKKK